MENSLLKIPVLKEKLREKERQLTEISNNASNSNVLMTSSWHQAMSEAKRQYEAIDGALEVRLWFKRLSKLSSTFHLFFFYFVDVAQYSEHCPGVPGASEVATWPWRDELQHHQFSANRCTNLVKRKCHFSRYERKRNDEQWQRKPADYRLNRLVKFTRSFPRTFLLWFRVLLNLRIKSYVLRSSRDLISRLSLFPLFINFPSLLLTALKTIRKLKKLLCKFSSDFKTDERRSDEYNDVTRLRAVPWKCSEWKAWFSRRR